MQQKLIALMIILAMSVAAAPALAQGYELRDEPEVQQEGFGQPERHPYGAYTDEELEKFVAIQDEVREIRQHYVLQIERAESPSEARELQQEAQHAIIDAIRESDMTVEHYNGIAVAYNADPQVRQRIDEIAAERDGS